MITLSTSCGIPKQKSGAVSAAEIDIRFCGSQCVFSELPNDLRFYWLGPEPESLLALGSKFCWKNLLPRERNSNHVIAVRQCVPGDISLEHRMRLLSTLEANPVSQVVRVHRHCRCGIVLERVEGRLLSTTNHQIMSARSFDQRSISISWVEFAKGMACLCRGLSDLHSHGIAHNDAFPFNAVARGPNDWVWIDLGDILQSDPMSLAIDIFTFLYYTFLPKLAQIGLVPNHAVAKIGNLINAAPSSSLLIEMERLLLELAEAESMVPIDKTHLSEEIKGLFCRTDSLGYIASTLITKGFMELQTAFEWNASLAKQREDIIELESTRHLLAEREIQRTLKNRYEAEIAELKGWNQELEKAKIWLDEQRKNWMEKATQLAGEIERAAAKPPGMMERLLGKRPKK